MDLSRANVLPLDDIVALLVSAAAGVGGVDVTTASSPLYDARSEKASSKVDICNTEEEEDVGVRRDDDD